jgi:hypothetical protein
MCDLASIVESQLLLIDSTISRTTTAIPLASVTGTQVNVETFPAFVVFDTVEYDTDNMVNLDADPYSVTPRRDGVYLVYGEVVVPAQPVPFDGIEEKMFIYSGSLVLTHSTPQLSTITDNIWVTGQELVPWTLGSSQGFGIAVQVSEVPLVSARLSVWWVCDL